MINKIQRSADEAVADIKDGSVVLIGGFGLVGQPRLLLAALLQQGARGLTVVANNAGSGDIGLAALIRAGRVAEIICSFPRTGDSSAFETAFRSGALKLTVVPQGTLSERLRAAGAGLGGFYTRVGVDTPLAEGKEHKEIDGQIYLFEKALPGDFALCAADRADRWGNLTYRLAARNFNPTMATAARITIAEANRIVGLGDIGPEEIITPGIFVQRVVDKLSGELS